MKNSIGIFLVGLGIFLSFPQWTEAQWEQIGQPENTAINAIAVSGSKYFVGTDKGVFLSTDDGTSWTAVNSGLPKYLVTDIAPQSVVIGTDHFVGTEEGIFRSSDNGKNWALANAGLPSDPDVSVLASIGSSLFAGTYDGVFRSTDNGASWTTVNSGLPVEPDVHDLAVIGTSLFVGTEKGVYRTINNGSNWTAASAGLPRRPVSSINSASAVIGENLFLGTEDGVFRSTPQNQDIGQCNVAISVVRIKRKSPLRLLIGLFVQFKRQT